MREPVDDDDEEDERAADDDQDDLICRDPSVALPALVRVRVRVRNKEVR
mgnify:CR=1 FL=1